MSSVLGYDYSSMRANKINGVLVIQAFFSIVCFIHFSGLIFFYAFVQDSMLMAFGYPALATSAPPPGAFYDLRYSFKWFLWASFALRILVPALAMYMLPYYAIGSLWKKTLHLTVSRISFFYELVLFFILLYWWCNCNWEFSPTSPCNDARYCCVYYPIHFPSDCPNSVACTPPVSGADLQTDPLFMLSFLSTFVLFLFSIAHILLNSLYMDITNAFLYTVQPFNPVAGA